MADGHIEIVERVELADGGAGILHVHLAYAAVVVGEVLHLAVLDEDGAEGETELDVVFVYELLGGLLTGVVIAAHEAEIALVVDEQSVAGGLVAVDVALIYHDTVGTEGVEVGVHGGDGVDGGGHLGGVLGDGAAEVVLGELAAELRGVGDLDLNAGADAPVDKLLPAYDEDGVVKIALYVRVVIEVGRRVENDVLPSRRPVARARFTSSMTCSASPME